MRVCFAVLLLITILRPGVAWAQRQSLVDDVMPATACVVSSPAPKAAILSCADGQYRGWVYPYSDGWRGFMFCVAPGQYACEQDALISFKAAPGLLKNNAAIGCRYLARLFLCRDLR
jgi:hypothetical protein